MRVQKNNYPDDFRLEAVQLYLRGTRSVREVAADLGINHWTLRDWVRAHNMKQSKKPPPRSTTEASKQETPEERIARVERENVRLRRENEQLRMDREILKKAAAFFAKESE
jgi:transposase